jgi:hypothetical protein
MMGSHGTTPATRTLVVAVKKITKFLRRQNIARNINGVITSDLQTLIRTDVRTVLFPLAIIFVNQPPTLAVIVRYLLHPL